MRKATTVRIAGFIGALCASGALVAASVSGTGAYFTDSHNGSINAGTGHIKVDVTPADGNLNFDNLLPGEYQTQRVTYTAHPSSAGRSAVRPRARPSPEAAGRRASDLGLRRWRARVRPAERIGLRWATCCVASSAAWRGT